MTDQELELRLRAWYRGEVADAESAPVALRTRLAAIPRAPARPTRLLGWRRTVTLLVAAMLLIGGAVVMGSWLVRLPSIAPMPPAPSISPEPTAMSSPSSSGSPAAGTWAATVDMAQVRGPGLTATLLTDGRVLVVGGSRAQDVPPELYDPASGTWTPTGSMVEHRGNQTATLLLDGRVLVAGGVGDDGDLASAELYDPESGRWTLTGSMSVPRGGQMATLLRDGRVLVVGSGDYQQLASAELYDPESGRWTSTSSMTLATSAYAATLLDDGRVLVAGGSGDPLGDNRYAPVEIYEPVSGQWSTTGSMIYGRWGAPTATLLADGTVLVTGGTALGSVDSVASAETYDPKSGRWWSTGSMAVARDGHTATLLQDGSVLVAGGSVDLSWEGYRASAEVYDPTSGRWTPAGSMAGPRGWHTATLLPDGSVLVAGGHDNGGAFSYLATAELYHPATGALTR